MVREHKHIFYIGFIIAVAFGFACLTFAYTTNAKIVGDAHQYVEAAYNLAHSGIIGARSSFDNGTGQLTQYPNLRPQMRREPLPIIAIAGFLLLHPAFDKPYTLEELTYGALAKSVKDINAVWRFLAALFIFLLCLELFTDKRVALLMGTICIIASEPLFFADPRIVNRLYTELPEAALMLLAAWLAVRFTRDKTKLRAAWLGIALGALALTKQAFLGIGFSFIVLLLVMEAIKAVRTERDERSWSNLCSRYAVIALAMLATVTPWIVRNVIEFRNAQINTGAGKVLALRMLYTEQPLLGGLYIFSPSSVRQFIGPITGYTPEDRKQGGRLEQFLAIKKEKYDIFKQRMSEDGYRGEAASWQRRAAIDYVIQHPLRYIASVGLFAYKGMWIIPYSGPLLIAAVFNVMMILCFFGVVLRAILTGNRLLVAAFGLPAGLFLFTSSITHALNRYNAAITPFAIIAVLWLLTKLVRKVSSFKALPMIPSL
jgi:hypothetical protein